MPSYTSAAGDETCSLASPGTPFSSIDGEIDMYVAWVLGPHRPADFCRRCCKMRGSGPLDVGHGEEASEAASLQTAHEAHRSEPVWCAHPVRPHFRLPWRRVACWLDRTAHVATHLRLGRSTQSSPLRSFLLRPSAGASGQKRVTVSRLARRRSCRQGGACVLGPRSVETANPWSSLSRVVGLLDMFMLMSCRNKRIFATAIAGVVETAEGSVCSNRCWVARSCSCLSPT